MSGTGLGRDRSGAVAIIVALSLSALLLSAGFAVDVGLWYRERGRLQIAADAGAIGAARLLGDVQATMADYQAAAQTEAQGVTGSALIGTPVWPPSVSVSASRVTVTIDSTADRFFSRLVPGLSVPLAASATAGLVQGITPCVLATDRSAADALMLHDGGKISATDCGVVSNSDDPGSSIHVEPGSRITAQAVGAVGGVYAPSGSHISPAPARIPPVGDPLAGQAPVSLPTTDGQTTPCGNGVEPCTFGPGLYPEGISLDNGNAATFAPGTYYITGKVPGSTEDISLEGGTQIAPLDGVTFVIVDSAPSVNIGNGVKFQISAPTGRTAGTPYPGIAFYIPGTGTAFTMDGGAHIEMAGAIYAPDAGVVMNNGSRVSSAAGGAASLIADTITIYGGAEFDAGSTAGSTASGSGVIALLQ